MACRDNLKDGITEVAQRGLGRFRQAARKLSDLVKGGVADVGVHGSVKAIVSSGGAVSAHHRCHLGSGTVA